MSKLSLVCPSISQMVIGICGCDDMDIFWRHKELLCAGMDVGVELNCRWSFVNVLNYFDNDSSYV